MEDDLDFKHIIGLEDDCLISRNPMDTTVALVRNEGPDDQPCPAGVTAALLELKMLESTQ